MTEYVSNEFYTIAVTGAGDGINFMTKDPANRIGMPLCFVDQFIIDLKRAKDAAEKRLDGGVEFIAG